jgi:hypothetical protein
MAYTSQEMYNPALCELLDKWVVETQFLSGGYKLPDYLLHVTKKDVPAVMSHLFSMPSWQVLVLLVTLTGTRCPQHIQGKFWHQVAWRSDWWETTGDNIVWENE